MTRVYPDQPSRLPLPGGQSLAFRRLGEPGRHWLALHGGPGSGAGPALWQGFDLTAARVLAPDQRGSGASRPAGSLRGQCLGALIDDLERLRRSQGLASWGVMGGSWGATLALMYAARHPQAVESLVLRGSFQGTRREVIRLLRRFWPRNAQALSAGAGGVHLRHLRPAQSDRVLHQLSQLFRNGTVAAPVERIARAWQAMEQSAALHGARRAWRAASAIEEKRELRRQWQAMRPALLQRRLQRADLLPGRASRRLWQKYRIQSHLLARRCGLRPGDWDLALRAVAAHGIATTWVHGRYDAVCPPANSLASQRRLSSLVQSLNPGLAPGGSRLVQTRAGHLGQEPGNLRALREALRHG